MPSIEEESNCGELVFSKTRKFVFSDALLAQQDSKHKYELRVTIIVFMLESTLPFRQIFVDVPQIVKIIRLSRLLLELR